MQMSNSGGWHLDRFRRENLWITMVVQLVSQEGDGGGQRLGGGQSCETESDPKE